MESKLPHYCVNGLIFIDYMEAWSYCLSERISTDKIIKSYTY